MKKVWTIFYRTDKVIPPDMWVMDDVPGYQLCRQGGECLIYSGLEEPTKNSTLSDLMTDYIVLSEDRVFATKREALAECNKRNASTKTKQILIKTLKSIRRNKNKPDLRSFTANSSLGIILVSTNDDGTFNIWTGSGKQWGFTLDQSVTALTTMKIDVDSIEI